MIPDKTLCLNCVFFFDCRDHRPDEDCLEIVLDNAEVSGYES